MRKRNIDPEFSETEADKIACELTTKLQDTTEQFILTLKPQNIPVTNIQFHGIFNALLNYFHLTLVSLTNSIEGTKDQLYFIKNIDSSLHHILSHILNDIGNDHTKH